MTTIRDLVHLRPLRESDLNFVRSSWLKSNARTVRGVVAQDDYYRLHWEIAMGLLDRPLVRAVVACSRDDEDQLLGWACGEASTPRARALAHYVYVKRTFRGQGLARALVEDVLRGGSYADVTATHLPSEDMRRKLEALGWTFRPQFACYLAMGAGSGTPGERGRAA